MAGVHKQPSNAELKALANYIGSIRARPARCRVALPLIWSSFSLQKSRFVKRLFVFSHWWHVLAPHLKIG